MLHGVVLGEVGEPRLVHQPLPARVALGVHVVQHSEEVPEAGTLAFGVHYFGTGGVGHTWKAQSQVMNTHDCLQLKLNLCHYVTVHFYTKI